MTIAIGANGQSGALLRRVEALSGQRLAQCYQCGTCAAGCPFAEAMDVLPDRLIRHLLFDVPGVLEREAFWVCVGCDLCAQRCPRGLDVPRVMEALRLIALRTRGDQLPVAQIPAAALEDLPPIALVASLRRQTG